MIFKIHRLEIQEVDILLRFHHKWSPNNPPNLIQ